MNSVVQLRDFKNGADQSSIRVGGGDPILRPPAASQFLGISASTLAKWRMKGIGPAFMKLGPHCVGYRQSELERFANNGARQSTSHHAQ